LALWPLDGDAKSPQASAVLAIRSRMSDDSPAAIRTLTGIVETLALAHEVGHQRSDASLAQLEAEIAEKRGATYELDQFIIELFAELHCLRAIRTADPVHRLVRFAQTGADWRYLPWSDLGNLLTTRALLESRCDEVFQGFLRELVDLARSGDDGGFADMQQRVALEIEESGVWNGERLSVPWL